MFMQLYKMGYVVIPLVGKAPAPGVSGWGEWAVTGLPEEEAERFEKHYPINKFGVGLVAGPASNNIVFIDADSVSKEIWDLVPPSPLERVGMRGFARVYSNPYEIKGFNKFRKNQAAKDPSNKEIEGIEVRSCGSYVAIPPTIHPDTHRPYEWTGGLSIEAFNPDHLPPLTVRDVERILAFEWDTRDGSVTEMVGSGRNNRLTRVVCGIITKNQGKTDKEIAEELLRLDEYEHQRPYFADKDELYFNRGRNPFERSLAFTRYHIKNLKRKGKIKELPVVQVVDVSPVEEVKQPSSDAPKLTGLLSSISNAVLSISKWKQEDIALGGAVAVCSALCANRFKDGGSIVNTKLYSMIVAASGTGKDAARRVAEGILNQVNTMDPEGKIASLSNYSSEPALISDLPNNRVRLDIIDEFGGFMKAANGSSGGPKESIGDFLNKQYTNSGPFIGYYTKTHGWQGGCFNPSISLMAMIQPEIFTETVKPSNISSGLVGRFLFFFGKRQHECEYLGMETNRNLSAALGLIGLEIEESLPRLRFGTQMADGSFSRTGPNDQPYAHNLGWGDSAKSKLDELLYAWAMKEVETAKNGGFGELITRKGQFVERLTYIVAACNGSRTITPDHLDLAIAIVDYCFTRSSSLLASIGDTKHETNIKKVLKMLKSSPGGFVSRRDIQRGLGIRAKECSDLIQDLVGREYVQTVELEKNGQKSPGVQAV